MRYGYIFYKDGDNSEVECPSRAIREDFNPRFIECDIDSDFAGIIEVTDEDISKLQENGFDFNETIDPELQDPDKFEAEWKRIYFKA